YFLESFVLNLDQFTMRLRNIQAVVPRQNNHSILCSRKEVVDWRRVKRASIKIVPVNTNLGEGVKVSESQIRQRVKTEVSNLITWDQRKRLQRLETFRGNQAI